MPTLTADIRQLSGEGEGIDPATFVAARFWPYRPYADDDHLVSGRVLDVDAVDGVVTTVLPETPVDEAMWVKLIGVPGAQPWLFQMPSSSASLWDLPHIDQASLTAEPESAAWVTALAGKQPLDDALTDLAGITFTDQQTVRYDSALGHIIAANPSGAGQNAASSNTTNAATVASSASGIGTIVAIPNTAVSVTNSNGRPVLLLFDGAFFQTVVGTGAAWLALTETTSGTVYRRYNIQTLPNVVNQYTTFATAMLPLGVVTTTRTFDLRIVVVQLTGSPSISVLNQATHPSLITVVNL